MNKLALFTVGMLVGAIGVINLEIKEVRNSKLNDETDDYFISSTITNLSDGAKFVRSYYKIKENK